MKLIKIVNEHFLLSRKLRTQENENEIEEWKEKETDKQSYMFIFIKINKLQKKKHP